MSVSGQLPVIVEVNPREALEQRRDQLQSSGGGIAISTPKRQIGRTTVTTVPSDKKSYRLTPGDGMSRNPRLAVLALVLNPQVAGL